MDGNVYAQLFRKNMRNLVKSFLRVDPKETDNRPERTQRILDRFNSFLINCGEKPVNFSTYLIDEVALAKHFEGLRHSMLDKETTKRAEDWHSSDPDIKALFAETHRYLYASNNQIKGWKKVFAEENNFGLWKVTPSSNPNNVGFDKHEGQINPDRKNLLVFMPFPMAPSTPEDKMRGLWNNNMRKLLSDPSKLNDVDIYVVHAPSSLSYNANVLQMMNLFDSPTEYHRKECGDFVQNHLAGFISDDIKIDKEGTVTDKGELLSQADASNRMKNLSIFGYCAGSSASHEVMNCFRKATKQLYDDKAPAMLDNIFTVNFAITPLRARPATNGIYIFASPKGEHNEAFVSMKDPKMYRTLSTQVEEKGVCFTHLGEKSYSLAFAPNKKHVSFAQDANNNGYAKEERDAWCGHEMYNVSDINLNDKNDNFIYKTMDNVLTNVANGKRGLEIFNNTSNDENHVSQMNYISMQNNVINNAQHIDENGVIFSPLIKDARKAMAEQKKLILRKAQALRKHI